METGLLRFNILLEQPGLVTPNAYGESLIAWTPVQAVWAAILPITAAEFQYAQSFATTVTHRVVIRYFPGLDATWRANYNGRLFSINGFKNCDEKGNYAELNVYQTLACTETPSEPSGTFAYLTLTEDDYLNLKEAN